MIVRQIIHVGKSWPPDQSGPYATTCHTVGMLPLLASLLHLNAAGSTFAKTPPDASKMAFRGGVPQTDDTGAMILVVSAVWLLGNGRIYP